MPKIHRTLWFRFLLLTILSSTASAQLPVAEDTFVASGTTTPQGTNTNMQVIASPINAALVKPDLSPIAGVTDTQVIKATMKLYVNTVSLSGNLDVCFVSGSWTEGSAVFTTKPSLTPTPLAAAVPVSTTSKYIVVDITSAVKVWQNGTANNGIALLPASASPCTYGTPNTSINVKFDSKENLSTSHDAGLNILVAPTPAQIPNLSGSYVDLSTNQTIGGTKTFSNPIVGNLNGIANSATYATNAGDAALFNGNMPSAFAQLGISNTFGVGKKQIFSADGTNAGLNLAGTSSDPSAQIAGDVWFNLTDHHLHFKDNQSNNRILAFTSDITNAGTVTSITAGSGLSGGTITTSGTIAIANGGVTNPMLAPNSVAPANVSGGTYGININGTASTITGFITGNQVSSAVANANNAVNAAFATNATNFTGSLSGDVTGTQGSTVVSAIGGVSSSNFARLDLANLFGQGKKQTFQPDPTNAGLNVAGVSQDPTTLVGGDVWFNTNDQHLHFRDSNNPQSLAFLSDLTSSNNSLLGASNHWTGPNQFDNANGTFTGMFSGNGTNLNNVNAALFSGQPIGSFVLQNGSAVLSSVTASTFSGNGAGITNLDAANVATGTLGDPRLSTNVALITRPNIFQADDKQTFTAGPNYAGLNIAGVANNPQTPTPGDLWLNTGDIHVQFRDNLNAAQSLAFLSDINSANSNLLGANNHWTGTNNFDHANGTFNGLFNGSFTGDGANLNNLTAANITAGGTAAINISGVAASALTAVNANNANTLGNQPPSSYARLDIGNAFTGDQTITGFLNASSSTGDAISGTSTGGNSGVSGKGAVGVFGTANGSSGSMGVFGSASVVDGLIHFGVKGSAADPNSIAGVFEHTASGKILSGRNNSTEVFSVDGNGKVTGDGSGLTNVSAGTFTGTINGSQVSGNISGNAASITGSINGSQVSGNISGNAASITGSITGGQVSSTVASAVLATSATSAGTAAALQGTAVSNTAPTNGQVLQYNSTNTQWQPTDITGNFIQNGISQQTTASFNIDGTGVLGGSLTAGGAILPAKGTATSGNPFNSNALDLIASSFSGSAVNQKFRWQAEGSGTTNTGSLNLLFASGVNTESETGLSIDNTGKIAFAAGQTFPGTQSSLAAGTGISISSNTISTSNIVPLLNAASNTFTGTISASSFSGSGAGLTNISGANISNIPNASLTNSSITINTNGASGLSGGATVALGGSITISANSSTAATPNTLALRDGSGDLIAAQFNGSGAGLTSLNASNLSTGTVPSAQLPAATSAAFGAVRPTIVNAVTSAVNLKNVTASFSVNCAAGRFLLGGGVNTDVTTQVMVMASYPSAAGTWTATLQGMNNNTAQNVQVTVYAICSGN